MPVGAEAQRPVIVEFPANDDTGLGDVYEERVKELDLGVARLLTHLDKAASDYLSPWRFASERCAARECVVIFLGDMLHSPRIRAKRSSSVPSLSGLSFPNAKIYLGFVRTQNGEPPSPEFQNRWVEEIRRVSGPKTTITVSSFGLDSLERFLRENVGPKRVPINLPVRSVVQ